MYCIIHMVDFGSSCYHLYVLKEDCLLLFLGLDENLHLEDEKQNRYEIYLLPKKLTKPYIGTHHALYLSTKGRGNKFYYSQVLYCRI